MSLKPFLSIVVPCYHSEATLQELCSRLHAALSSITEQYEIILIDDESPDASWGIIQDLAKNDPRIRGIRLSRNFGQHRAILAGLDHAEGDWIVVMDCDLQDPPEEIPKLYTKAMEGYDIVVGRRAFRKDPFFRRIASKLFFWVFSTVTGVTIDNRLRNFGIYSKAAIQSIRKIRDQNLAFGLSAIWVGFRRCEIDLGHEERFAGRSGYSLIRLVRFAITCIVAYSNRLLHVATALGGLLSILSFLYAIWLTIKYFIWRTPVAGWTSLIVSLYFLSGLMLGSIGIVGLYIGKIFDEVKARPLYLIAEATFPLEGEGAKP